MQGGLAGALLETGITTRGGIWTEMDEKPVFPRSVHEPVWKSAQLTRRAPDELRAWWWEGVIKISQNPLPDWATDNPAHPDHVAAVHVAPPPAVILDD